MCTQNSPAEYTLAFTAAVRASWLAMGGKNLGPPIRREGYKGLAFSGALRLFGAAERRPAISLPDCLRIWAESAVHSPAQTLPWNGGI